MLISVATPRLFLALAACMNKFIVVPPQLVLLLVFYIGARCEISTEAEIYHNMRCVAFTARLVWISKRGRANQQSTLVFMQLLNVGIGAN
jgi:hypothetical protein